MNKDKKQHLKHDNGRFFPALETAAIGSPITRSGISFFPVYLKSNGLPKIATGPKAKRVIDEVSEEGSVPELTVTNPKKRPLLLLEGEQFIGGKQNRTLNVTVLVPPGSTLTIPVSCLEQGRWGRRRDFQAARTYAPRRVRRTLRDAVASQAATPQARSGAQGEVWGAVEDELRMHRMSSPTAAVADADRIFERDRDRGSAAEELARRGPLPGQCGFVATHGPRIVGTEIFGAADLLRPHWSALGPVLPARRADGGRLALGGQGAAGAAPDQPGPVQERTRPGHGRRAALLQREGRRARAHPRRRAGPRVGDQPVAPGGRPPRVRVGAPRRSERRGQS